MKGAELRAFIAERLKDHGPEHPPALRGDFDLSPHLRPPLPAGTVLRPAAVLIPLFEREDDLHVLLTRRADHLANHAGQISFPGGREDPDDPHPVETALREAEEEIALERRFVDVVGSLDPYVSGTGFSITPVIGFLKNGFTVHPHEGEVAEIFDVPFAFLMDPVNRQRHAKEWNGTMRHYYAMPYGRHYIWGATAGILVNLWERLYGTVPAGMVANR